MECYLLLVLGVGRWCSRAETHIVPAVGFHPSTQPDLCDDQLEVNCFEGGSFAFRLKSPNGLIPHNLNHFGTEAWSSSLMTYRFHFLEVSGSLSW